MTTTELLTWADLPDLAITAWIKLNPSHIDILTESLVFTEEFKELLRQKRSQPPDSKAFTGEGDVNLWDFKFEAVVSNLMERVLRYEYEKLGKNLHYHCWFAGPVLKAWNVRKYIKGAMYATGTMEEAGLEWFGPSHAKTEEWEQLSYSAGSAMRTTTSRLTIDLRECGLPDIRPHWGFYGGRSITTAIDKATALWQEIRSDLPDDMWKFSENLELSLYELDKAHQEAKISGEWRKRGRMSFHSMRRVRDSCDSLTRDLTKIPSLIDNAIQLMWDVEGRLESAIDVACHRFVAGYPC